MKRFLLLIVSTLVALFLLGSVALWLVLSRWVPTQGKALVIRELERLAPVDVAIGTIRYQPFQGLLLERISVKDRTSHEAWFAAPSMRIRVNWLGVVASKRVAFRAYAPVQVPCETLLDLVGVYDLRAKTVALDLQTSEVALRTLASALRQKLPPALTDGIIRPSLHLRTQPNQPAVLLGRIVATHLAVTLPSGRVLGDLVLDGRATAPHEPGAHWAIDAQLTLHDGAVEDLPIVHTISGLQGRARWRDDHLEIEELTGTVLASPWTAVGVIDWSGPPRAELLLSAPVSLRPVVEAWPALAQQWRPDGTSETRAVCRGVLQARPLIDCLVHARWRNVTVSGTKLPIALTGVLGEVDYDGLTRWMTIHHLAAELAEHRLAVEGSARFNSPMELAVDLKGSLPLESLAPWLPATTPVADLKGAAGVDLHVEGRMPAARIIGEIEVRDAHAQLPSLGKTIEGATGRIRLSGDQIELNHLALRLDEQPIAINATVTRAATPLLVGTIDIPNGQVAATARLFPDRVQVDDSTIRLPGSRLRCTGRFAREAPWPSTVNLEGVVELAELSRLPLLPLPTLAAWRLQGPAQLDVQFDGPLADWTGAMIRAEVAADQLQVLEVPFEGFHLHAEQHDGLLQMQVPPVGIAEGRGWGDMTVRHQGATRNYQLQVDLVGLQLARLSQTVPTWRTRPITGTASAHAQLLGTWEQRATWRGEGWLNVSGEHLGQVPLLEGLFRGLFGTLAERLGFETLRRAEITQASLRWRLASERFTTEDLRLAGAAGSEPIAIYAKGSVGLDQTLDVVIEPEFSEATVLEAPATSSLVTTVLRAAGGLDRLRRLIGRHRLTGTLQEPHYHFELSTQEVLKQLVPGPADLISDFLHAVR